MEHAALSLCDRILRAEAPVVIIRGPAGTGKSQLLRQIAARLARPVLRELPEGPLAETCLCDLPPSQHGRLPMLGPAARLIVACRGGVRLTGLARARAHGKVLDIGPDELLAEAGGWPVAGRADAEYLREELLSPLPTQRLLALFLARRSGIDTGPPARTDIPLLQQLESGLLAVIPAAQEAALDRAFAEEIAARAEVSPTLAALAVLPQAAGHAAQLLLDRGRHDAALEVYRSGQGWYQVYQMGPRAYADLLDSFPEPMRREEPLLVMSQAIRALKSGQTQWARRQVAERFGAEALDIAKVLRRDVDLGQDFRTFRIVMLIYEDLAIGDALIDLLHSHLDDMPLSDDLHRGTFYNAMSEFYMRLRRLDEAEEAMRLALSHYRAADMTMLAFYVELHRAVLRLLRGDVAGSERMLEAAAADLKALPFEAPGDARLVRLIRACIAFDKGQAAALVDFFETEFEAFASGETWPTLLELSLIYGAQAIAGQYSVRAAVGFLERWGLTETRNRQYHGMMETLKARTLQSGGRWTEAARVAAAVRSRVSRVWVEAAGEDLTRLTGRDERALALIWLRQIVEERPDLPLLGARLAQMSANPGLTSRQRMGLRLLQAEVARRTGDLSLARQFAREVFAEAAQTQTLSPLAADLALVERLMGDRRVADYVTASTPASAILRRLRDTRTGRVSAAAREILTARELRILSLLVEGASNKLVARNLDISEATVKFHLTNLFRKLGCANRREAVANAEALGWFD
ncbi:helix-turn-helix transcriptional regulator [Pseudoroseicyclus tamaricis]|uniref:HTH luxR-type domain-containing protein n=1 Tax=Pseudoroseicyclus tamaricis TaxID=2705421 RepID=A0A6B2JUJ0_9RHOB|nr:LuxR family transcriptional regulator [Pseudoroseicyclus tamaricis]NDU99843.1 hypothetical protein [Pseudoroseicyclus tamaricis]